MIRWYMNHHTLRIDVTWYSCVGYLSPCTAKCSSHSSIYKWHTTYTLHIRGIYGLTMWYDSMTSLPSSNNSHNTLLFIYHCSLSLSLSLSLCLSLFCFCFPCTCCCRCGGMSAYTSVNIWRIGGFFTPRTQHTHIHTIHQSWSNRIHINVSLVFSSRTFGCQ